MDDYKEKAYYYKGKLIDTFNELERAIDDYIVYHFMPEAPLENEFHTLILNKLPFEQKRLALKGILNNKALANGFVPASKNPTWPTSSLLNAISKSQEDRNRFAHDYTLDTGDKDAIIVLAGFKNGYDTETYTLEKFNKIIIDVIELTKQVHALE